MAINPVYYPTLMQNGSIPGIDGNNYNPNPYGMLTRRGYRNEYNSKIYTNLRIAHDLDFWNWSKGLSVTATLAFDTWTGRTLKYNKMEVPIGMQVLRTRIPDYGIMMYLMKTGPIV